MIKIFGANHLNKDDIINNGVFCPIPWIHFVTYPDGTAQICTHQSNNKISVGNIFDNTFEEIINHENLIKIRHDMLHRKDIPLCSNCKAFEKANNGKSSRTHYLNKFKHLLPDCISNTKTDGTFFLNKNFRLAYWNFKLSGVCNLKCRTCHPHFSTSIYHEYKSHDLINENDILDFEKIRENLPRVMEEFFKHIKFVEEIHFVGGEPMLMSEHWQVLEELIKNKKLDVRLSYHTNLTRLDFKSKQVFDYWKQFTGEIWLSPSVDAFSDKNSYIRHGSNWDIINENLDKVLDLKKKMVNMTVVPTITASVFNVFYLDELVDYFHSKNLDVLNFNIVRVPAFYHVAMLPDHLKSLAVNKLNSCIIRNFLNKNIFNIIKSELFNDEVLNEKGHLLNLFKENTLKFDKIRNTEFKKIFPELEEMLI